MKWRLRIVVPVLLPLAIFLITGFIGLDYGTHWDEGKLLESVRTSVYTDVLLPTFYNYPSVPHDIGLIAALPEIVRNLSRQDGVLVFHNHIAAFELDNDGFLLRVRAIFLILSSLTIVWVYSATYRWRRHIGMALLAACLVSLSWEVAYHARWIAPDAILMQFGALVLLCVIAARQNPDKRRWLWASAIAAGLGTGTKYPGGLLLLPVLVIAWQTTQQHRVLLQAAGLFALVYLLSTPGTLLEPLKFIGQVEYEIYHYGFGHSQHTVNAGVDHLARNLLYLGGVVFSRHAVGGLLFGGLALIGVVALWRESRGLALLIMCFPVAYLLFMSMQRAMIVRNLLVLVPYLALLSARGAAALWAYRPKRVYRAGLATVIVTILALNAAWLVYAAGAIADRGTDRFRQELIAYVWAHPDERFYASAGVRAWLGWWIPPNVTRNRDSADRVLLLMSETRFDMTWPVNQPDVLLWIFGSQEVNIHYYNLWAGDDRVLLLR